MITEFREIEVDLHSDDFREILGNDKTTLFYRHTFNTQGDYTVGDLEILFSAINSGNKYVADTGRTRHCYKGNTIFRVFLARSDEDGNLIEAHWFTLTAAKRFTYAYSQLPQALDRLRQGIAIKPNYLFEQVGAVEVETTLTERDTSAIPHLVPRKGRR